MAVVFTLATLVWGFVVVGSPDTRRLERLDERRVEDLQRIVQEIQRQVYDNDVPLVLKHALPKDLDEARSRARYWQLSLVDPETGEAYGYILKNETTYELCATFALERAIREDLGLARPGETIVRFDPPAVRRD